MVFSDIHLSAISQVFTNFIRVRFSEITYSWKKRHCILLFGGYIGCEIKMRSVSCIFCFLLYVPGYKTMDFRYIAVILYDTAHRTTVTMIKLRSDLYSRMTPHTWSLRASFGVSFVSYTKKKWPRYIESTLYWAMWKREFSVRHLSILVWSGLLMFGSV